MTKFDIRKHITKRDKIAFLSSIIFFFLIHMFRITNFMPNHDALENLYARQNIIGSGRWFLTVACLPSSYFEIPWIIGIFSSMYIAITVVLIVQIFDLKNKSSIIITSALIVGFPSISETLIFDYTADGYFLSMLLATLAIRLVTTTNQKWYMYLASGLLLCFSCGIYQAYFSFAGVLVLVYLIIEILNLSKSTKSHFIWCIKQFFLFTCSLAAYYIIWKVLLSLQNADVNTYQGIHEAGLLSFSNIVSSIIRVTYSIATFVFGLDITKGIFTGYTFLGITFFVVLAITLFSVVIKRNLYKKAFLCILFFSALFAIPFVVCIWQFVSLKTVYYTRMLQSLSIVYILPIILTEKFLKPSFYRLAFLIICVISLVFSLRANIAYIYLNQCYEATYHTTSEMLQRAHIVAKDCDKKIAVVGNIKNTASISKNNLAYKLHPLSQPTERTLAYYHTGISLFTKNTFFNEFDFATEEELSVVEKSPLIQDMPCWPAKDSVKLVDGYIVIKLANPETEQN